MNHLSTKSSTLLQQAIVKIIARLESQKNFLSSYAEGNDKLSIEAALDKRIVDLVKAHAIIIHAEQEGAEILASFGAAEAETFMEDLDSYIESLKASIKDVARLKLDSDVNSPLLLLEELVLNYQDARTELGSFMLVNP